jgi:hypothetical protein
MKRIIVLFGILLITFLAIPTSVDAQESLDHREKWLKYMDKVARPVLSNLAEDKLRENMPVVLSPGIDNPMARTECAYLEAFARTLCGISPWLNIEGGSEFETNLRNQYREWAIMCVTNAVDTSKNDYMLWSGYQPLVDASFFALAIIRCPWLWENLDVNVQQNVVNALLKTRSTIPVYTNWILFSSMIEAFFCKYGFEYDKVRIEYGIREFSQHWYVGDGLFSDGMHFSLDYYNSYVIQPYILDILEAVNQKDKSFAWFSADMDKIAARYAEIQERSINTDGSFPVYGRSIVYRGGAFHHLANMALQRQLPTSLSPEQIRCALTAVIQKTLDASNTFTEKGWLNIGLYGLQPNLADFYINTGSLYLCSTIFLPLGLPSDDPFWTNNNADWTSKKIWEGKDTKGDHSFNK